VLLLPSDPSSRILPRSLDPLATSTAYSKFIRGYHLPLRRFDLFASHLRTAYDIEPRNFVFVRGPTSLANYFPLPFGMAKRVMRESSIRTFLMMLSSQRFTGPLSKTDNILSITMYRHCAVTNGNAFTDRKQEM
jgi:hypothetical protein